MLVLNAYSPKRKRGGSPALTLGAVSKDKRKGMAGLGHPRK